MGHHSATIALMEKSNILKNGVVKAPDPRLRVVTKPVKRITPTHLQIFKDMIKLTKTFKDPEGVGLASTQVGLDEAYFIALDEEKFRIFINPKILSYGKRTKEYFEGCLSVPTIWGTVKRHLLIKVSYQDETGKQHQESIKGVLAWIFQHETDHINGKLFSDRVLEQSGKFYKFTGRDQTGADTFEEVTI